MKHPTILFDTDIGTDVDDAFALVVLTRMARLANLAVVTTNGPTRVRAQATLTLLHALNRPDIAAFEGIPESSSGVPAFTHGKESKNVNSRLMPQTLSDLTAWLKKQPEKSVRLITTGPLTTTAWIFSQKRLVRKIDHLFIMGGSFPQRGVPMREHNFSADPKAVQKILKSKTSIFLVPLNATIRHPLTISDINTLKNNTSFVGKLIWQWTTHWLEVSRKFSEEDRIFRNAIFLHDPITVFAAIRPDAFQWKPTRFTVNSNGVIYKGGNKQVFVCTKVPMDVIRNIKQVFVPSVSSPSSMI